VRAGPIALATLVLAAGCGGSSEPTAKPDPVPRVTDRGRINDPNFPIAVRDVSFAVPGGRVQAYLVVPPGSKRRAAAVYVHGQGGDRQQLLVPATWLAARGAVTIAITAPSSTAAPPPGISGVPALEWQRDVVRRDLAAVRGAVELLARRPDVDAARIGYVGWSAGARTGALLAGSERRIRAFALMSGGAEPLSAYVDQAPEELRDDVARILGSVDPLQEIAKARPGTLLLQNGRRDNVVPVSALELLAEAAPSGTRVRWYDAAHQLGDAAFRDQLAWLEEKLRIDGPPVEGAKTGP
jgi:dienelactone hydrolase